MIIRHLKFLLPQQRGAVLVLFATVFLPLLLIGSILAVDISSVYVQKTQLQTTADAAALTGAAKIRDFLNDKRSISTEYPKITSDYVKNNLNLNNAGVAYKNINVSEALLGSDPLPDITTPDNEDVINASVCYNATKNTVQVTLRRRVPLYYFRMTLGKILPGGFSTMPIAAQATAEYGSSGTTYKFNEAIPNNPSNNPFNYVLTAGSSSAESIELKNSGMYFKGDIRTNGKIKADNYGNETHNRIKGTIYGDNDNIWNNLSWNDEYNVTWLIEDSTSSTSPDHSKSPNIITNNISAIDISNKTSNTNTQILQSYITEVGIVK